jgi:hypothetical protein
MAGTTLTENESSTPDWHERAWSALRRRGWEALEYVGDALLVVVALFSRPRTWNLAEWSWWGFYVPFTLGLVFLVLGKWKQSGERRRIGEVLPKLEALENENAELRGFAQDALNQELLAFAIEELEFTNSERVSLYFRRSDGFFQFAGRYSPDSSYKDARRTVFSDKESLLVKTYREGDCDVKLTPKSENAVAWRAEQQALGLSIRAIRQLRMPTSHYVGFVLRNSSHVDFAVIMFESVRTDVLVKSKLGTQVASPEGTRIVRVLEQTIKFLPDPKAASEAGL